MRTDALSYWRLLERPRRALFRARFPALLRARLPALLRARLPALLRALLRLLLRALRFRLVGARGRAPNAEVLAERFDRALLLFVRLAGRAGVPHFAHRARPKF